MRTILLVSLLGLSFGLTALSLLSVRYTLHRQIQRDLSLDLEHSMRTFGNLEQQRRDMLARETALLADLPTLKALMTTQDQRTVEDGGVQFWQISGGDLFELYDNAGHLMASYGPTSMPGNAHGGESVGLIMQEAVEHAREACILSVNGLPYEVIAQPLSFGARSDESILGYVVLGFAINQHVAQEVSEASAAEVAFTVEGKVAVSTLPTTLFADPNAMHAVLSLSPGATRQVTLGGTHYLATATPLSGPGRMQEGQVELVVLRSYEQAARLLSTINRWLLGLGMLALVMATLIAVSISRLVTRPLEMLVESVRALGRGDFTFQHPRGGTAEICELAEAFDHTRLELESSQRALVDSERLATIGRMASSISHDLRHFVSAMYANAEFLSLASTTQTEREQLIFEVQTAVNGMTDLLDSLLVFSRTGKSLLPSYESIPYLIERAVGLLRAHPEAHSLDVRLNDLLDIEAWVDATKFTRAVFNLLLNACQAANRGTLEPCVTLQLYERDGEIVVRIEDNGPGVPASLATTIFEPFVSRGREAGTGLGLTLAQHIAQEHGGLVRLDQSAPGKTVFTLTLVRAALERLDPESLSRATEPVLETFAKGTER